MIPLVVRVEDLDGGGAEQFAFIRSPVRIGRGELNDVPLQRPFVSTYHGLIQFDDQETRYVDLGSTNGSTLDGARLERNTPVPVGPDTELLIGSFRLTFARRATSERPGRPRPPTAFAVRASSVLARPPPTPPPEPEAAAAAAEAVVDAASIELDLQYASYRGAWEHLRAALETALAGLDEAARRAAFERFATRYPSAAAEPGFRDLAGPAGPETRLPVAGAGEAPSRGGDDARRLLGAFAESYLGDRRPDPAADAEALLGRVALVLETFGRSFVELRRGYEEFGRDMGVRTIQGEGPVHRARDARELLAYLLEPRADGRDRELQRGFAEIMIHEVALLRGVTEGARALLGRISPEALEAQGPKGVWPLRAAALWKAFEARFHELADEDRAITGALFGKEFARAYAATAGEAGPERAEASAEPPPPGRPPGGAT